MHPFPPADEFQCLIGQEIERVCFNAFLHNHWAGLAIFVGIVLDYALR